MLRPVTVSSTVPPEVNISSISGVSADMGTLCVSISAPAVDQIVKIDGAVLADLDGRMRFIVSGLRLLLPRKEVHRVAEAPEIRILPMI